MKTNRAIYIIMTICTMLGASPQCATPHTNAIKVEKGVSQSLARQRVSEIRNVEYKLDIDIPASADSLAGGHADISFTIEKQQDVVIDFFDANHIINISVKGAEGSALFKCENEHIIIDSAATRIGSNTVSIDFSINQSLINRRSELLYTLSVPDKARRLFPCFDQPDMKATYTLTLTLPAHWKAVSNGAIASSHTVNDRTTVSFAPTEPLSTYLFAFAAGRLERREMTRGGRTIALYHCDTDSAHIAQCDEILGEVFASLEWVEKYTSIPYPFAKYDLIIIPGFQFGGMEHTGATLYNDRMLFLTPQATLDERLARTSLIAHETAHMWFGDYVTMKWFGEVWTKEVFANYYAACMAEPLYPDVDHRLRFMLSYAPTAYAEDRTEGANSIQQNLDNLQDAGLIYGNIIYDKSPMMMRQLVQKVGAETFRQGISRYLKNHAYGNATWDELITTLDSLTTENLTAWSNSWVNVAGMPIYRISRKGRKLTLKQEGAVREQKITFMIDGELMTADCNSSTTTLRIPADAHTIIPNADGMAYGYFAMDKEQTHNALNAIDATNDLARGALLINLHEALWHGDLEPATYIEHLTRYLPEELNPLLFNLMVGHLRTAYTRYAESTDAVLEKTLSDILFNDTHATRKVIALRALADIMDTPQTIDTIYRLWSGDIKIDGFTLSDIDAMRLSYQLAVRMPEMADSIVARQRGSLKSDNLRREYDFISPAVSPRQADRDSLFAKLLTPEGREIEPWAESALAYLNHRCRKDEAMRYVRRGLEEVEDVKRTGDIFFPKRWVTMLVSGHPYKEVRAVVKEFLDARPDYPEMLKRKILMNVYDEDAR